MSLPNGKNDKNDTMDNQQSKPNPNDFGMVCFSTTTRLVHEGLINLTIAEGIVYSLSQEKQKFDESQGIKVSQGTVDYVI